MHVAGEHDGAAARDRLEELLDAAPAAALVRPAAEAPAPARRVRRGEGAVRDEEHVARVRVGLDLAREGEEVHRLEVAEDPAVVVHAEGEEREGDRRADLAREELVEPAEGDAARAGGAAVVVVADDREERQARGEGAADGGEAVVEHPAVVAVVVAVALHEVAELQDEARGGVRGGELRAGGDERSAASAGGPHLAVAAELLVLDLRVAVGLVVVRVVDRLRRGVEVRVAEDGDRVGPAPGALDVAPRGQIDWRGRGFRGVGGGRKKRGGGNQGEDRSSHGT